MAVPEDSLFWQQLSGGQFSWGEIVPWATIRLSTDRGAIIRGDIVLFPVKKY